MGQWSIHPSCKRVQMAVRFSSEQDVLVVFVSLIQSTVRQVIIFAVAF